MVLIMGTASGEGGKDEGTRGAAAPTNIFGFVSALHVIMLASKLRNKYLLW